MKRKNLFVVGTPFSGATLLSQMLGAPVQRGVPQAELRSMHLPLGPGHLWVATESAVVRRLRSHLVDERGVPRERLVVRGYWRSGVPNHPDHDYAED